MIGGGIAILAPWLCSVFRVGDQYHHLVVWLLRIYAPFTVFLSFVTPVFTAGICSFMRYDVQNHITMSSHLVISLMLFVFLSASDANPLIVWCLVMMVGAVIRTGVLWVFYCRYCFGGKLGLRWVDFKILRPLFQLGGSMYVLQLTQMLAVQMDPLIISRFIGPVGVALYQAGSKLPQMVNPLVSAMTGQLTPLTTKYHVESNRGREQQVLILGTKYTLYLGAFFSGGMIVFADSFCRLWLFDSLGEDVKTVSLVMKMWALADLLRYAGSAGWPILLGKKKMKYLIWLNVPTAIFNVIFSVYLVGYTNFGVAGVLVGTVVTDVIRRFFGTWYLPKIVNCSKIRFIKEGYLAPTALFLLIIAFGTFINFLIQDGSWIKLFLSGGLFCCCGVCLIAVFEWAIVKSFIGRKLQ
jgi:O-antigen/teichoic acid export membrane protein